MGDSLKKIWDVVNTADSTTVASKISNLGVWIGAAIALLMGIQSILCKLGVATSCTGTVPPGF